MAKETILKRWQRGVGLPIILLFLILFVGCTNVIRRPALSSEETNWQVVAAALQRNFNNLHTFKGFARLLVDSPQGSFSASSRVVINRPDSMYVKVEGMFGIDVGWMFSDRSSFIICEPMENLCYTGSVDSLNLYYFISFNLSYDKIMQTLVGLRLANEIDNATVTRKGDEIILVNRRPSLVTTFWIDPSRGVVKRAEIRDPAGRLLQVEQYDRFGRYGDIFVPRTIRIQRPVEKEAMTLFYNQLDVNKGVSPKDFRYRIPESAVKIPL